MLGYIHEKGFLFKANVQTNGEQQLESTRGIPLEYNLITSFRADRNSQGRLVGTILRARIATFADVRVDDKVQVKNPLRPLEYIKARVVSVEHYPDMMNPSKMVARCDIEMLQD